MTLSILAHICHISQGVEFDRSSLTRLQFAFIVGDANREGKTWLCRNALIYWMRDLVLSLLMPDSHPLVCRFGALGDMILITPLLKLLFQRSGLTCDIVAIGAWNKPLFERMPYVRNVFCIDSRSTPYWFNRSQRELVKLLTAHRHQYVWVCETSARSYRLLARAGITRSNSANQLDLPVVQGEHYCEKWLRLGNLSLPGFDYPQRAAESLDTELFLDVAEVRE